MKFAIAWRLVLAVAVFVAALWIIYNQSNRWEVICPDGTHHSGRGDGTVNC